MYLRDSQLTIDGLIEMAYAPGARPYDAAMVIRGRRGVLPLRSGPKHNTVGTMIEKGSVGVGATSRGGLILGQPCLQSVDESNATG